MAGIGLVIFYFYHLLFRVTTPAAANEDFKTLINLTPTSQPQASAPSIGDFISTITPTPILSPTPVLTPTVEPIHQELLLEVLTQNMTTTLIQHGHKIIQHL